MAALFWYFRNLHFYKQNLQSDNRVSLIKYSKLVSKPNYLNKRLSVLGFEKKINTNFYHKRSLDKGKNLKIHSIIQQLCSDLYNRLNYTHKQLQKKIKDEIMVMPKMIKKLS